MYSLNQPQYDNVIKPTILCIAESSHYLVGVIDPAHNLLPLEPEGKVISCSSLAAANTNPSRFVPTQRELKALEARH